MPEFAELREVNRRIDEMALTQKAPEKTAEPGRLLAQATVQMTVLAQDVPNWGGSVLDVHLRTVDGVSVVQEISEDARACQIPVVAITGVATERVPSNVIKVVCKPVAEAQLIDAVRAAAASRVSD